MISYLNEIDQSKDGPVLVIGGAGLDIVGKLESEPALDSSNPAEIRNSYGGVARNVAENLARLGQEVILLTVVGNDRTGDQLLSYISQAGVNVDYVLRSNRYPTG